MKRRWLAAIVAILTMVALVMLLALAKGSSASVSNALSTAPPQIIIPTVTAIDPTSAYNDLDTSVVITGANFTAELSGTLVLTVPTAYLGSVVLADVTWVNSTTLNAVVPWGMDPGVYTLTVTNPDGQSSYLSDAFTVTQGIGVWTSDGPYGGAITTILVHPLTPTVLYAAVHDQCTPSGSGLFRSLDGGINWRAVLRGTGSRFHAVDLSVPSPSVIYAYRWGEGIYRSDDDGETWVALPMPPGVGADVRPYAHPTDPNVVYAVIDCGPSCGGVYRSQDQGETWVERTAGITDTQVTAMAFDPSNPQIIYVGTRNGNVFRSNDDGNYWVFLGKPDDFIGSLAVNPFGSHEVWAAGGDIEGHWGYLWKYVAGNWVQVLPGSDNQNKATTIVFHPTIPGLVWIGTQRGSLKSEDAGNTWESSSYSSQVVSSIAIDSNNDQTLYVGYGGIGLYKTNDGGISWVESNRGLAGICANGLAIHPGNPAIVYTTAHGPGTFKTNNGGGSWRRLLPENHYPRTPVVDPFNPRQVYIGQTNSLWFTEDEGLTWSPRMSPEPPPQYSDCCRVEVLSLLPTGHPGHLVMGVGFIDKNSTSYAFLAGGIYTSTNYGESWGYVDVGQVIGPVAVLVSDPNNQDTIYAGTGVCCAENGSGVWKSEDGGKTWRSSGLSGLLITGLAIDPFNSQVVYAASLNHFYVSADGGINWTLRATQDAMVDDLLVLPTMPPTIYHYGWPGTMRSTDSGLTWMREDGLLGYANIGAMVVTRVEGRIVLYVSIAGSTRLTESRGQEQTVTDAGFDSWNAGVYRYTYRLREYTLYLPLVQR